MPALNHSTRTSGVDRQPLDRPRVLQEERRIVVDDPGRFDRRVPHVDRARLPGCVVLIEIAVVRGGHAAVRADLVVVAELEAVRTGDVRQRPPDTHGACCPGAESGSIPRSCSPDCALFAAVNAHSSSTCRCVSVFLRLDVPQRRAARLLDAGHRRAQPVEQRPGIARLEQQAVGHRRGPPDVADGVMRMLRIAELRRARILPGAEVLALALPPPLHEATRACASAPPATSGEAKGRARRCRGTS